MKTLLPVLCALCMFTIAADPAAAGPADADSPADPERGIASWYGGKFHGRLTANGEIFDTNKLTAAHRTLPFGTHVKVTSLNTGKSVIVRINDRGPFLHGRIIDLSQAAAMKIGMLESGTAPVTVEVLTGTEPSPAAAGDSRVDLPEPALPGAAPSSAAAAPSPEEPDTPRNAPVLDPAELPRPDFPGGSRNAPSAQAAAPGSGTPEPLSPASPELTASPGSAAERFRIQLGSFSVRNNALGLKSRLERAGFLPRLEPAGDYTRVVLTGLTESEVSRILSSLERAGFSDYLVRAD